MDASLHPKKYPELSRFLEDVVGFDSVDDESKPDFFELSNETLMPDKVRLKWTYIKTEKAQGFESLLTNLKLSTTSGFRLTGSDQPPTKKF